MLQRARRVRQMESAGWARPLRMPGGALLIGRLPLLHGGSLPAGGSGAELGLAAEWRTPGLPRAREPRLRATRTLSRTGALARSALPASARLRAAAIRSTGTDAAELGRRLGVSKQAAGKAVDRLVALGYGERTRDPADSRRRLLRLTERSHDCLARSADGFQRARWRWVEMNRRGAGPRPRGRSAPTHAGRRVAPRRPRLVRHHRLSSIANRSRGPRIEAPRRTGGLPRG